MEFDYESVRINVLSNGVRERVQVNQRALIDKILARYASPNALYRELLQNSNDAAAQTAEIHFTTTTTSHGPCVERVVYRNDGFTFRDEDWDRMRRIAEGNPDVNKVRSFGVGAYAMFGLCEEPLVMSGEKAMAFSWACDTLSASMAQVRDSSPGWTSFVLVAREHSPMPDLVDFGKFLCATLTFTSTLACVQVIVDGKRRLTVWKRGHAARDITSSMTIMPSLRVTSPVGLFSLASPESSVVETNVEVTVKYDESFARVRVKQFSAVAKANVIPAFNSKMVRITKKHLPQKVKLQIFLSAGASCVSEDSVAKTILEDFCPKNANGHVFTGFRTMQTTGIGAHIAAPFVATVDGEVIDLHEPTVRVYNRELLAMCGIVCRIAMEEAMDRIGKRWQESHQQVEGRASNDATEEREVRSLTSTIAFSEVSMGSAPPSCRNSGRADLEMLGGAGASLSSARLQHLLNSMYRLDMRLITEDAVAFMRSFSPSSSAPCAEVGKTIMQAFLACMPAEAPPVLSTSGVVRGPEAKLPDRGLQQFVRKKVVEEAVVDAAEGYLRDIAFCRELAMQDLLQHAENCMFNQNSFVRVLAWWTQFYKGASSEEKTQGLALKDALVISPEPVEAEALPPQTVFLKDKVHYLKGSLLTVAGLPIPDSVLPTFLQQAVPMDILGDVALADWFQPLSCIEWATFVCEHPCLTSKEEKDSKLRFEVLKVLSDLHFDSRGDERLELESQVGRALGDKNCVPCNGGLMRRIILERPCNVYLSSRDLSLCDDLYTFREVSSELRGHGVSDTFLTALGVQPSPSIEFILSELSKMGWNSNAKQLVELLQSRHLTDDDLTRIQSIRCLPEASDRTRMYAPFELCLPNAELDVLPFVKQLYWPSIEDESPDEWSDYSKFLKRLGCLVYPSLKQLIKFLQSEDLSDNVRLECLRFLHRGVVYDEAYRTQYKEFLNARFLPCTVDDPLGLFLTKTELHSPKSCYLNDASACLGFPILSQELRNDEGLPCASVFRCESTPTSQLLIFRLLTVAKHAKEKAESAGGDRAFQACILKSFSTIFKFLSCIPALSEEEKARLQSAQFIPHTRGGTLGWCRPKDIFFQRTESSGYMLVHRLFPAVEFSSFLALVGVRSEPSLEDVSMLLRFSASIVLSDLGTEQYFSLLRWMAGTQMSAKVVRELKRATFLPGYVLSKERGFGSNNNDDDDTETTLKGFSLAKAKDIYIVDNRKVAIAFRVLTAPQELELENMYAALGSKFILTEVEKWTRFKGKERYGTQVAKEVMRRIEQRRKLLTWHHGSRSPPTEGWEAILEQGKLEVCEVPMIQAWYSLKGSTKTETVSCAIVADIPEKAILYITKDFLWYHVGDALCELMFKRHTAHDAFYVGSMLQASLPELRTQGFLIDDETQKQEQPRRNELSLTRDSHRAANGRSVLCFGNLLKKASLVINPAQRFRDIVRPKEVIPTHLPKRKQRGFSNTNSGIVHSRRFRNDDMRRTRSAEKDREAQKRLEGVLRRSVNLSRRVSTVDISARKTVMHIPDSMGADDDECEVLSGHELKPIAGPEKTGKTSTGVPVFGYHMNEASEEALVKSWEGVEGFAAVLLKLCNIFKLKESCIAIFHEAGGRTVAFNSKRSLYFNARYFLSLHWGNGMGLECFCYWFCTMAHEIAHNTVIEHSKRHGYITQRIIENYLPEFVKCIPSEIQGRDTR